jgi:hypothetical protein
MAQQANNTPASSGGKGGGNSSSRSSSGSKSSTSKASTSGSKTHPLLALANKVPAHHAKHGMQGPIEMKGKWSTWHDGQDAFKG